MSYDEIKTCGCCIASQTLFYTAHQEMAYVRPLFEVLRFLVSYRETHSTQATQQFKIVYEKNCKLAYSWKIYRLYW